MNRVVVLFSDADLREVKKRAGLVPLSTWIRNQLLQSEHHEDRPPKNVRRPRAVRVVQQRADPVPAVARVDACAHGKQKSELCYKCDPRFGYPVIAKGALP